MLDQSDSGTKKYLPKRKTPMEAKHEVEQTPSAKKRANHPTNGGAGSVMTPVPVVNSTSATVPRTTGHSLGCSPNRRPFYTSVPGVASPSGGLNEPIVLSDSEDDAELRIPTARSLKFSNPDSRTVKKKSPQT